jgi:protein TonB
MLVASALCGSGCSREHTVPGAPAWTVTPAAASMNPGQRLQFQSGLLPPVSWEVVEGYGHGLVDAQGEYQAPYFPADRPTVTVRASSYGSHADASVTLLTGPADRHACCGTMQDSLPAFGDYVFVDELPEPLHRVSPIYPLPAIQAGVEGTVVVQALVCAPGQLNGTRVVRSIPMLDAAAEDAVRQWVFAPALANGEPVAVWVGIPVKFSLH